MGSHVARLNFKMSHVGVYKCFSLIVSFAITITIWAKEVVSCRDFILHAFTTFWAMSLVGIYPDRASFKTFSLALMSKKILGRRGGGHFDDVAAHRRVEI